MVRSESTIEIPRGLTMARYEPEVRCRTELEQEDSLRTPIERARRRHGAAPLRRALLADAVRVNERILPEVARCLAEVAERAGLDTPFETYVGANPMVNAAVLPGRDRIMVFLSSAAIERLDRPELDFVVGHELGHAVFDHVELPAEAVLAEEAGLEPRLAMRLMGWRRRAEIAADRAGLACCGSLASAASAMFKIVSGLGGDVIGVDPRELADQWDELAAELVRDGRTDFWRVSHPFPPLRMRAMVAFHESMLGDDRRLLAQADRLIEDMLGIIDPLAREDGTGGGTVDPMLREHVLHASLAVAASGGGAHADDLARIGRMVGAGRLERELAGGPPPVDTCRARFAAVRRDRTRPLSAVELRRILLAAAEVAVRGSDEDSPERACRVAEVRRAAESLGVADGYVTRIIDEAGADAAPAD